MTSGITAIQALESILNRTQFAMKTRALNLSTEDKDFLRARLEIKGFKVEKGKAKAEGALAGLLPKSRTRGRMDMTKLAFSPVGEPSGRR